MDLDFGSPDDLANALQQLEQASPDFFANTGTIVDFTLPSDHIEHLGGDQTNDHTALDAAWMSEGGFLQPLPGNNSNIANEQLSQTTQAQRHFQYHQATNGACCAAAASLEESPEPVPPPPEYSSSLSAPRTSSAMDLSSGSNGQRQSPELHVNEPKLEHVERSGYVSSSLPYTVPAETSHASGALTPEMLQAVEMVRAKGTSAPRAAKALAWRAYRLANLTPDQVGGAHQEVTNTTNSASAENGPRGASPARSGSSPEPGSLMDIMGLTTSSGSQSTGSPYSQQSGASPVPTSGPDADYSPPRATKTTAPRGKKANISKKVSSISAASIVHGAGIKAPRGAKKTTATPNVGQDDVIAGADAVAADASAAVLASKASLAKLAERIAAATSAEEKAKLKKLKNREAAQLSRNIQREYVTSLESKVEHLAREKSSMEGEMQNLRAGYASMADEMSQVKALLKKFMGGSPRVTPRGSMDPPPSYPILGAPAQARADGAIFNNSHPQTAGNAARSGAVAGAGVAFFVIFFAIGFGFVGPRGPASRSSMPGDASATAPPWLNGANVQRAGGKVLLTVDEDAWPRGSNVDLPNIPEADHDKLLGKDHHSEGDSPCICPCYCDDVCVPMSSDDADHSSDADLFEAHDSTGDHDDEHHESIEVPHKGNSHAKEDNLESRMALNH